MSGSGAAEIVEQVRARLRAEAILVHARTVVVLLSGGRDSTCLLDAAVEIVGAGAVRALHVDYGLRRESAADAAHCESLAARLGVQLTVMRASDRPVGNVQAWARELRYGAAAALAGGTDVAAGHTADDQVETILYRLASSPSRRALLGMRARDGNLIRPLLGVTRAQTTAYCLARGLQWRDDSSNDTDAYARNRVRRQLLPALQAIHPAAESNLLMLAEILRDEAAALDDIVDQSLGGRSEVELAALRALPIGVARLVVQRLADAAAGAPAPGTARRLDEILAMRDDGVEHLDLPHRVRATARDGLLRFETNTLRPR